MNDTAFEAGRRVVRERRQREHAAYVAARNRARLAAQPHVAREKTSTLVQHVRCVTQHLGNAL